MLRFLPLTPRLVSLIAIGILGLGTVSGLNAADPAKSDPDLFEQRIRPLLSQHCLKCHGGRKSESGLKVDSRESLLKGGATGPAIVPGAPDKSLLIRALQHTDELAMPPDEKLDAETIAAVSRWISQGAPWPEKVRLNSGPQLRSGPASDQERKFWSFQPLQAPAVPTASSPLPSQNAIDSFVIEQLQAHQLRMRPPADKRTLIRRATFDLTGLPPTANEIQNFLNDTSPSAFSSLVERLLASPAYGERWGRHWLDVVRYADTAGETADYPTPLAYKYRDWVISAFNRDLPYDEFLRLQIAGDLLAPSNLSTGVDPQSKEFQSAYRGYIVPTGFIAISRRFGYDVENYHHLTIQDTIDTIGQTVLGLSLGCARCHDHKYDPVDMADYYAWYGIFQSTRYSFPGSEEKKRPYDSVPVLPPAQAQTLRGTYDQQLQALKSQIADVERDLKDSAKMAAADAKSSATKKKDELSAQLKAMQVKGPFGTAEILYGAIDLDQPADAAIQQRGELSKLGAVVPRRNLQLLGGERVPEKSGSGRRELADWLTRPNNPLTARVMVNRIWQNHFGRGLVRTENDFGARGEPPTHPQLLDWLATEFVRRGWSVKDMHRLIMSSTTYQQGGDFDAQAFERDPDARWLWRFNRRRLSAEEIRDAMLSVSGELDDSPAGPHPFPGIETWGFTQHSPYYGVYPTRHRSVYLMQQRLKRHPFLGLFDGADPNVSTPHRDQSTVPTQALYLMNNPFVHEQAQALVRRAQPTEETVESRVRHLYLRALARAPSPGEVSEVTQFLASYRQMPAAKSADSAARESEAWQALARTLLIRNEFLYVD